jgi:hypothetical protein
LDHYDKREQSMSTKPDGNYTPESVTALLELVGIEVDAARAPGIAGTLNAQVKGAHKAFAGLSFETEPATYLVVAAKEAP